MTEEQLPENPQETLDHIREKMQSAATDFAEGRINRAQFNAIYGHYSEQQAIIERLVQRNPESQAWRQAAAPGHTTFLRNHFQAQVVFFGVFKHKDPRPLFMNGEASPDAREQIARILKSLWSLDEVPAAGLARKSMGDGSWIVLATGEQAVTIVLWSLQPSANQNEHVRNTHADFERANAIALSRNLGANKMVFPQRALMAQTDTPR